MIWIKKNSAVISLVLTTIGIIIAILSWQIPKSYPTSAISLNPRNNSMSSQQIEFDVPQAQVTLSGVNVNLEVKKSSKEFLIDDTQISAINAYRVLFLSERQLLKIVMTGTNINIVLDKAVAEQVAIEDNGVQNRVVIR